MTEDEVKQAFKMLRQSGESDKNIAKTLKRMYEAKIFTENQYGALLNVLGYPFEYRA